MICPKKQKITQYSEGLKPAIATQVRISRPATLEDATRIATSTDAATHYRYGAHRQLRDEARPMELGNMEDANRRDRSEQPVRAQCGKHFCRKGFVGPLLFVDSLLEYDLNRVLHSHALDIGMCPAVGAPGLDMEGVELMTEALWASLVERARRPTTHATYAARIGPTTLDDEMRRLRRLIVNCTVWCHQTRAAEVRSQPNVRITRVSLVERIFRHDLIRYGMGYIARPAGFVPPRRLMSPQYRETFEQRRVAITCGFKRKYDDFLSGALTSFADEARKLAPLIDLGDIITSIDDRATTTALEDAIEAEQEYHYVEDTDPFPKGVEDSTP